MRLVYLRYLKDRFRRMALGKYSRVDGKTSSTNIWSTTTFVVFVGLCLVGVWIMTSSSMVSVQNVVETSQEAKNEVQTQLKDVSQTGKSYTSGEDKISSDTNSRSESNMSSDSKLNSESNLSSEIKTNNESTKSNPNIKSSTNSVSTNSNTDIESNLSTESNSNSESTESNTNIERTNSYTDSERTKSSINNESSKDKTNKENDHKQFEDNPGDLPEDATKGDNVTVSTNESGSQSDTGNKEDNKEDAVSKTEDNEHKDIEKKSETERENSVDEKINSSREGDSTDDSKTTTVESDEGQNKDMMQDKIEKQKADKIAGEKEALLSGAHSELLNETMTKNGAWKTQVAESKEEANKSSEPAQTGGSSWKLCNVTAGPDYIPCLDNIQALKSLRTTMHYEHRERHCPDDPPTCLVPLPEGYQRSIEWPTSREKIWYRNVPHTQLVKYKGHQNCVKVGGEYLTFPGGGTQFKHGALHYIDFIQEIVPDIGWGKHSRVVLDVGCGVASFGGFLFDRDVLAMSFAPKDEHEAQVQFALERGIPALSAVMGTKRLPFPGKVFDIVHCARCRVPWHIEGGKLLLELNRVLRPGGYFVWSATPVYQKKKEDVEIWKEMKQLTKAMCWGVTSKAKDRLNGVGVAVFRKPLSNECYEKRPEKEPPLCNDSDDPNASWNVPLQACMHRIPVGETERGSKWPEQWPLRLERPPYWLSSSQVGVYGKAAPEDFVADYEHWKRVVSKSYVTRLGINWSSVRNVMDMRAIYGGFAAALRELNVWVMNVVNIDSPDTLPIIYERGLFGIYHDWCESFNTYPRTYDLLHADHLFSRIRKRCSLEAFVVEVDRILRPEGKLIVRDNVETIRELKEIYKSMQWVVHMNFAKDEEGLLYVQKSMWRPKEAITLPYAIS